MSSTNKYNHNPRTGRKYASKPVALPDHGPYEEENTEVINNSTAAVKITYSDGSVLRKIRSSSSERSQSRTVSPRDERASTGHSLKKYDAHKQQHREDLSKDNHSYFSKPRTEKNSSIEAQKKRIDSKISQVQTQLHDNSHIPRPKKHKDVTFDSGHGTSGGSNTKPRGGDYPSHSRDLKDSSHRKKVNEESDEESYFKREKKRRQAVYSSPRDNADDNAYYSMQRKEKTKYRSVSPNPQRDGVSLPRRRDRESTPLGNRGSSLRRDRDGTPLGNIESSLRRDRDGTPQRDIDSSLRRDRKISPLRDKESQRQQYRDSSRQRDRDSSRLRDTESSPLPKKMQSAIRYSPKQNRGNVSLLKDSGFSEVLEADDFTHTERESQKCRERSYFTERSNRREDSIRSPERKTNRPQSRSPVRESSKSRSGKLDSPINEERSGSRLIMSNKVSGFSERRVGYDDLYESPQATTIAGRSTPQRTSKKSNIFKPRGELDDFDNYLKCVGKPELPLPTRLKQELSERVYVDTPEQRNAPHYEEVCMERNKYTSARRVPTEESLIPKDSKVKTGARTLSRSPASSPARSSTRSQAKSSTSSRPESTARSHQSSPSPIDRPLWKVPPGRTSPRTTTRSPEELSTMSDSRSWRSPSSLARTQPMSRPGSQQSSPNGSPDRSRDRSLLTSNRRKKQRSQSYDSISRSPRDQLGSSSLPSLLWGASSMGRSISSLRETCDVSFALPKSTSSWKQDRASPVPIERIPRAWRDEAPIIRSPAKTKTLSPRRTDDTDLVDSGYYKEMVEQSDDSNYSKLERELSHKVYSPRDNRGNDSDTVKQKKRTRYRSETAERGPVDDRQDTRHQVLPEPQCHQRVKLMLPSDSDERSDYEPEDEAMLRRERSNEAYSYPQSQYHDLHNSQPEDAYQTTFSDDRQSLGEQMADMYIQRKKDWQTHGAYKGTQKSRTSGSNLKTKTKTKEYRSSRSSSPRGRIPDADRSLCYEDLQTSESPYGRKKQSTEGWRADRGISPLRMSYDDVDQDYVQDTVDEHWKSSHETSQPARRTPPTAHRRENDFDRSIPPEDIYRSHLPVMGREMLKQSVRKKRKEPKYPIRSIPQRQKEKYVMIPSMTLDGESCLLVPKRMCKNVRLRPRDINKLTHASQSKSGCSASTDESSTWQRTCAMKKTMTTTCSPRAIMQDPGLMDTIERKRSAGSSSSVDRDY